MAKSSIKKFVLSISLGGLIVACADSGALLGEDRDSHGCIGSAGQSYSKLLKKCVRVFEVADLTMPDPDNETLAIYGIFSQDKTSLELFWASLDDSEILLKNGENFSNDKLILTKNRIIKK